MTCILIQPGLTTTETEAHGALDGNCAGTRNVLKAAAMAGVPRLVHVSTEAVLVKGDLPISDADESTPVPDDPGFYAPYSKSKAMAERLVLVSWPHGLVQWKQAPEGHATPSASLLSIAAPSIAPTTKAVRLS